MSVALTTFLDNLQEFFALITLPTLVGASIFFGRKLQTLDQVDKTMNVMKKNIKIMSNAMIQSSKVEWDGTLLRDYSPLSLTEEGLQYLEKTHFIDIYREHEDAFVQYIEEENPKTKYDAESLAVQSVLLNADSEFMEPVKVYLYNNPKDSLASLAKVAGVYIRDKYLEQHPEIDE